MGLPSMYEQAQGHAASKDKSKHIKKIPTTHVMYVMQYLQHSSKKSAKIYHPILPLYITTGTVYDYGIFILMFL